MNILHNKVNIEFFDRKKFIFNDIMKELQTEMYSNIKSFDDIKYINYVYDNNKLKIMNFINSNYFIENLNKNILKITDQINICSEYLKDISDFTLSYYEVIKKPIKKPIKPIKYKYINMFNTFVIKSCKFSYKVNSFILISKVYIFIYHFIINYIKKNTIQSNNEFLEKLIIEIITDIIKLNEKKIKMSELNNFSFIDQKYVKDKQIPRKLNKLITNNQIGFCTTNNHKIPKKIQFFIKDILNNVNILSSDIKNIQKTFEEIINKIIKNYITINSNKKNIVNIKMNDFIKYINDTYLHLNKLYLKYHINNNDDAIIQKKKSILSSLGEINKIKHVIKLYTSTNKNNTIFFNIMCDYLEYNIPYINDIFQKAYVKHFDKTILNKYFYSKINYIGSMFNRSKFDNKKYQQFSEYLKERYILPKKSNKDFTLEKKRKILSILKKGSKKRSKKGSKKKIKKLNENSSKHLLSTTSNKTTDKTDEQDSSKNKYFSFWNLIPSIGSKKTKVDVKSNDKSNDPKYYKKKIEEIKKRTRKIVEDLKVKANVEYDYELKEIEQIKNLKNKEKLRLKAIEKRDKLLAEAEEYKGSSYDRESIRKLMNKII